MKRKKFHNMSFTLINLFVFLLGVKGGIELLYVQRISNTNLVHEPRKNLCKLPDLVKEKG